MFFQLQLSSPSRAAPSSTEPARVSRPDPACSTWVSTPGIQLRLWEGGALSTSTLELSGAEAQSAQLLCALLRDFLRIGGARSPMSIMGRGSAPSVGQLCQELRMLRAGRGGLEVKNYLRNSVNTPRAGFLHVKVQGDFVTYTQ